MMNRPWLNTDIVKFVGEPIVAIVTETAYQGEDAAEMVFIDYEPLPAIIDLEAAAADEIVIQVLLTLLHHSGAKAAQVVRYLRGHSPPISLLQVDAVFARYDLESIGKKGGSAAGQGR